MKISSVTSYKVIALVSFLILSGVQIFLVYNTYKLKNEHYFLSEKQIINDDYAQSISNDKVFPGGGVIIDKYIYNNISKLEQLHRQNPYAFNIFEQKLCSTIFKELHRANNFDSLLKIIEKRHQLKNKFT